MRAAIVLASGSVDDEVELVDRLRAGDESAFVALIGRYQQRMLRVAETTVGSRAVAEEVTEDTWLAAVPASRGSRDGPRSRRGGRSASSPPSVVTAAGRTISGSSSRGPCMWSTTTELKATSPRAPAM